MIPISKRVKRGRGKNIKPLMVIKVGLPLRRTMRIFRMAIWTMGSVRMTMMPKIT